MNGLESLLTRAGDSVAWPETDLSARVLVSLDQRARPRRRRALALAAVAVLIIASLLALPTTRRAIADLLGVAGIRIELGADGVGDAGYDLDLGSAVTLADAISALEFTLAVPDSVPAPDGIYLSGSPVNRVDMAWSASSELPEIGDSDVGLLVTQFHAIGTTMFLKRTTQGTEVVMVPVDGQDGFWLEGAPHLLLEDQAGVTTEHEISRLAANVLIWESRGITYRIESKLDLTETLAIAASMMADS